MAISMEKVWHDNENITCRRINSLDPEFQIKTSENALNLNITPEPSG